MPTLPTPVEAAFEIILLVVSIRLFIRIGSRANWFRTALAMEAVGCTIGLVAFAITRAPLSFGYGALVIAAGSIPLVIGFLRRESLQALWRK